MCREIEGRRQCGQIRKIIDFEKSRMLKNRTIAVSCHGYLVEDVSVLNAYCEMEQTKNACESGCINYGKKWSCPPYSRRFTDISGHYRKAVLLVFRTKMEYYSDVKNKYTALKAANVTLKSLIEKCARMIEKQENGYALLSGSCRLCKKCACRSKQKCRKPDAMRYSMEATMLNVEKICSGLAGIKLQWYQNGTLPEYTSTVSMVLLNDEMKPEELADKVYHMI